MKKKLYLLLAGFVSLSAAGQLQNLNFEDWDFPLNSNLGYNRPTGWLCSNRWFGYPEQSLTFANQFVDPVENVAQSGNHGIRLFTFYNYMKDSAVQIAAINSRPAALTGYYKYEDNFVIWATQQYVDTAQVVVVLTKWNAALAKKDTIGLGRFRTHVAADTFTPFQADIAYFSPEQPDSITIFLDPSFVGRDPENEIQNAAEGGRSIFTVDNLALLNQALDTDETRVPKWQLYPNPTAQRLHFQPVTGLVSVFDLTGRKVLDAALDNATSVDVSHLPTGTYIAELSSGEHIYKSKFIKQ